jgi:hypothetical protein
MSHACDAPQQPHMPYSSKSISKAEDSMRVDSAALVKRSLVLLVVFDHVLAMGQIQPPFEYGVALPYRSIEGCIPEDKGVVVVEMRLPSVRH